MIAAGQLTVPRPHPDYFAAGGDEHGFGGQFTARLNMNLREDKGYTYGYRSRFDWRQVALDLLGRRLGADGGDEGVRWSRR